MGGAAHTLCAGPKEQKAKIRAGSSFCSRDRPAPAQEPTCRSGTAGRIKILRGRRMSSVILYRLWVEIGKRCATIEKCRFEST